MRICMVVSSLLEFGGLEEFAKDLAVGIQEHGHNVSVISTAWVPPNNQYLRSLREHQVTYIQLPKWLSLAASDWPTKEKIRGVVLVLLIPLILLLGLGLALFRRRPLGAAITSARNWMQGQLMRRVIGPRLAPAIRSPDAGLVAFLLETRFVAYSRVYEHAPVCDRLGTREEAPGHLRGAPDRPMRSLTGGRISERASTKPRLSWASPRRAGRPCARCVGVTRPVVVAYYMVADPYKTVWKDLTNQQDSSEPLRISTVARLYVTKGLTYLLETIALVKAVHPTVQFRVYGEGPLRDELLAYAEKLGLDGKQIFVGRFHQP